MSPQTTDTVPEAAPAPTPAAVPGKRAPTTLDLFWRLGEAKTDGRRVEASCKVLAAVASQAIQPNYALTRLVRGLAAPNPATRQTYFICLTEYLRQTETKYPEVQEVVESSLKAPTTSKSEEADYLLARLLTSSAVLRAGLLGVEHRVAVLADLVQVARARHYLHLPAYRLMVEHFVPEGGATTATILDAMDLAKLDMDSLYLLLNLLQKDEVTVSPRITEALGVEAVWGKRALNIFARVLLAANAPPEVVAQHPLLPLLVTCLAKAGVTAAFWQAFSADMTAANNSALTGWTFLREVGRAGAGQLPPLLTRHALSVGQQIEARQGSAGLAKEVLGLLVAAVEEDVADRTEVVRLLLAQDVTWDKTPLGGQVAELVGKAEAATVREVGELYLAAVVGEGKPVERAYCGGQVARLVGHPAVQADLAWRGKVLQALAAVGLLQGVEGVGRLTRQGQEGLRDTIVRALDSRNKNLEDSVTISLSLVTWMRDQLAKDSVTLMRPITPEQEGVAGRTMEVVGQLEARWAGGKDKEAGVLLLLHCHMWIQLFIQSELAVEVLEELGPVYTRWSSRQPAGGEEPDWVEVVTEILLSILASNNRLLRGVTGSVFAVICPQLTQPALLSLLTAIKKKSQIDEDEDEEDDEDDDEMDEDEDDNEGDEDDASDSEDSDSDGEEVDEALTDKLEVSGELVNKVTSALGEHAAESDEEDLDMDAIPDEDMANLDKKLAEAFKAIGGRKDRLTKKKEAMAALAETHFKLRVLDLVEIFLSNKPKVELLCSVVPALVEALERAVRAEAGSVLVTRLVAVLGKVAGVPNKLVDTKGSGEEVVAVLQGLLARANAGSVVVGTLGKTFARLTTTFLRLGECAGREEELEQVYLDALQDFLHSKTCVLPPDTLALALAHQWRGCWALAGRLAAEALSSQESGVRQFRRISALSLLSGLLNNKKLVAESAPQAAALEQQLLPAVTGELTRLVAGDLVRKVKPRLLQELFSLLLGLQAAEGARLGPEVQEVLRGAAAAWPEGRHFNDARKVLVRLGQRCGANLVVTIRSQKPANGEESAATNPTKKKNKKKKKTQDQLKKAKEMKMEMAKAQVEEGVPSFTEFVTDNTEVVEEAALLKRKGLEDGTSNRDKKHKRKKVKKEAKE